MERSLIRNKRRNLSHDQMSSTSIERPVNGDIRYQVNCHTESTHSKKPFNNGRKISSIRGARRGLSSCNHVATIVRNVIFKGTRKKAVLVTTMVAGFIVFFAIVLGRSELSIMLEAPSITTDSENNNTTETSTKLPHQQHYFDKINTNDIKAAITAVPPRFIFGHSTGHSGSGTVHSSLIQPGCPWSSVNAFENIIDEELVWPADPDCSATIEKLVPFLLLRMNSTVETFERDYHKHQMLRNNTQDDLEKYMDNYRTYVDIGHFHNRGRTIECLAKYFGDQAVFVHVRRDRYAIAQSFVAGHKKKKWIRKTPCIVDFRMYGEETERLDKYGVKRNTTRIHPRVANCPRSGENAGSVNLPVPSDLVWDKFTPFQRFLWYADEMEHRWHTLKSTPFDNNFENIPDEGERKRPARMGRGRPRFFDITWNDGEQLHKEVNRLRNILGCSPLPEIKNEHKHISDKSETLPCSEYIRQDLEYRNAMKYNEDTLAILTSKQFPQHVDGERCPESREEVEQVIKAHSVVTGLFFDKSTWVLPGDMKARSN